jgi:hypothetical protein
MARAMYPFSQTELDRMAASTESAAVESKRKSEWVRRGAFKTRPMSPRETRIRCESTRLWLYSLLLRGPRPAAEVYRLARAEGISAMGVRRAKRYHGIRTIKTGGKRQGWGSKWIWSFPECVS